MYEDHLWADVSEGHNQRGPSRPQGKGYREGLKAKHSGQSDQRDAGGDAEIATREPPSWRSGMGVGCLIYISLRPLRSAIMQHLPGKPTQCPMPKPFHFPPPLSYLKYAALTYCSVLLSGSKAPYTHARSVSELSGHFKIK